MRSVRPRERSVSRSAAAKTSEIRCVMTRTARPFRARRLSARKRASVSSGASLNTTMFAVPPNEVVVFEVAIELDRENDSGNIEADFASGDFQIACPVVVFSLLNSPPGAMA